MIVWNKVTPLSQAVAITLFVGVFALGFYFGGENQKARTAGGGEAVHKPAGIFAMATYECTDGKHIHAHYQRDAEENESVALELSDSRTLTLPLARSASGARYANTDESIVFWNKGNTAFFEENGTTTFADCATH